MVPTYNNKIYSDIIYKNIMLDKAPIRGRRGHAMVPAYNNKSQSDLDL